jgi:glycosyltransferase involved in cell wall biosynthesis
MERRNPMNLASHEVNTHRPLVFFDFMTHYGGSFQSTVLLLSKLQEHTDVAVVDVYGACAQYIADLHELGIKTVKLFPSWSGRTTIGGRDNRMRRIQQLLLSIPSQIDIALRLRAVLRTMKPRALWVNSEKALFTAWLAAPRSLPLAVYVRGELQAIRPLCFFAWRRANGAIGVSQESLSYLRTTTFAQRNLHVVYNGADVDRTIERARPAPVGALFHHPGCLRVVIPGRLTPEKGHEIGMQAVARFIEQGGRAELCIAGDVMPGASSDYFESLLALRSKLKMDEYIHFLGWRNDILSVLRVADIVVLTSHFGEGLPRSLIEAMSLGKPVIATRSGGVPELVRDGLDGYLVEIGDIDGITKALSLLQSPADRKEMGLAGAQRIRSVFRLEAQSRQFLKVMDQIAYESGSNAMYYS